MAKKRRKRIVKKVKDGLITLVAVVMFAVMCLVLIAEKANTSAGLTYHSAPTEVSRDGQ